MTTSTSLVFNIDVIIHLINEFIKNDNNLLNCNRYLSKFKYFNLNIIYSFKYLDEVSFKNLIHSRMRNSKLQLSLNFINLNLKCRLTTDMEANVRIPIIKF